MSKDQHTPIWTPEDFNDLVALATAVGVYTPPAAHELLAHQSNLHPENDTVAPVICITSRRRVG